MNAKVKLVNNVAERIAINNVRVVMKKKHHGYRNKPHSSECGKIILIVLPGLNHFQGGKLTKCFSIMIKKSKNKSSGMPELLLLFKEIPGYRIRYILP
jgi:hypothetical protein